MIPVLEGWEWALKSKLFWSRAFLGTNALCQHSDPGGKPRSISQICKAPDLQGGEITRALAPAPAALESSPGRQQPCTSSAKPASQTQLCVESLACKGLLMQKILSCH